MANEQASAAAMPTSYIVIPARLASTRLPRKLLLRDTGKTLIQHTFEAARRAKFPREVVVATDHEEIRREVESFGAKAWMTSPDLASGTDRVAAIAHELPGAEILVNVQGDEPEIQGAVIDALIAKIAGDPSLVMATLATPIRRKESIFDPALVKVVFDNAGKALYFSRSAIPAAREWRDEWLDASPPLFHQHIGVYAYRRSFLMEIARLPPSPKEQLEKLEQLRVLDAGHAIGVVVIAEAAVGIDTPADYRAFVERSRRG